MGLSAPRNPSQRKHVELPHVVVMKFENRKVRTSMSGGPGVIARASELTRSDNLPVAGLEQANALFRIARGQDDGSEKS